MTSAEPLLVGVVGNVYGDRIEEGVLCVVASGSVVRLLTYRNDHEQGVVLRKIFGLEREEVTGDGTLHNEGTRDVWPLMEDEIG